MLHVDFRDILQGIGCRFLIVSTTATTRFDIGLGVLPHLLDGFLHRRHPIERAESFAQCAPLDTRISQWQSQLFGDIHGRPVRPPKLIAGLIQQFRQLRHVVLHFPLRRRDAGLGLHLLAHFGLDLLAGLPSELGRHECRRDLPGIDHGLQLLRRVHRGLR